MMVVWMTVAAAAGLVAGWLSVVVYAKLSNQARIAELKAAARDLRTDAMETDSPGESMARSMAALRTSFKLFAVVLGPSVAGALPVVAVYVACFAVLPDRPASLGGLRLWEWGYFVAVVVAALYFRRAYKVQ